jgi:flagellar hook-associated protein 2
MDRYGALTFDKDEFAAALADDKEAVMELITDSSDGMAARFKSMTDDYTLSEGFLTIRKSMYSSRSTDLNDTISRMEDRVLAYEKRLKHQFAQLEQMVSGLNQQSSALARLK